MADIVTVEFTLAGSDPPSEPKVRAPKLHMSTTDLPHDVHRNMLRKGSK